MRIQEEDLHFAYQDSHLGGCDSHSEDRGTSIGNHDAHLGNQGSGPQNEAPKGESSFCIPGASF